jgi:hypothetical protein
MEGIMTDVDLEDFFEDLARVVRERDRVPVGVLAAAKAGFSWRRVDDELAWLVHDSADEELVFAGVRGGSARQLTFSADELTIELEVGGAARGVVGQLVPAQPASIEVRSGAGSAFTTADELGRFDMDRVPDGPVSLRVERSAGGRVATDWVRL